MPTITLIRPDETVEVIQTPDAREWIVDNLGLPILIEDWTRYGNTKCQAWASFGATDWNCDASALYLLSHAKNMANASDFQLFGPIALVQE